MRFHWTARRRTAAGTLLAAAASLMVFINPLLAGVLLNRLTAAAKLPAIAPVVAGMAVVKGTRMLLRSASTRLLRGHERAPVYLLRERIGSLLWWLEPMFHSWGAVGMAMSRMERRMFRHRLLSRRLPVGRAGHRLQISQIRSRVASAAAYYLSDTCVTLLGGAMYYYTRSRLLALLPGLLPAVGVVPWFAERLRQERQGGKRPFFPRRQA